MLERGDQPDQHDRVDRLGDAQHTPRAQHHLDGFGSLRSELHKLWRRLRDEALASEAPSPIVEPLRIDPLARREGVDRQPRLVHRGQRGTSLSNGPAATSQVLCGPARSRHSPILDPAPTTGPALRATVYTPIADGLRRNIDKRIQANRLAKAEGRANHRLRQVMDLWAAQWAWPLEHAGSLPTRKEWWTRVEAILGVETTEPNLAEQLELEAARNGSPAIETSPADEEGGNGKVTDPVAQAVQRIAPFHWPLEFPEVIAAGGFDLMVGNPPWIKLQWNELGILGDLDARVVLDGLSAALVARDRGAILRDRLPAYLAAFEAVEGAKAFLNAGANHPLLEGVQTNLYKCFIEQGWRLGNRRGVLGLVHQPGVFDDPRGGALRKAIYLRLRHCYRFENWLLLFSEIMITRHFCLSVFRIVGHREPSFVFCGNLFHPSTIDASWHDDRTGPIPGIKTEDNQFETRGHRGRLVLVDSERLRLFANVFDGARVPQLEGRLPVVHSSAVVVVLERLAQHRGRLGDLPVGFTEMWHETNAQRDGTIRRETRFPQSVHEWILSGPHFFVATPLSKTPREGCRNYRDYESLDLVSLPEDYLPRTNYVPAVDEDDYRKRMTSWRGRPVSDFFRHVHRKMLSITAERTLATAIIPPGAGHIDGVNSIVLDQWDLIAWHGMTYSLISDFMVRSGGKQNLRMGTISALPCCSSASIATEIVARVLRLNCLTRHYEPLWNEFWSKCGNALEWSFTDSRLSSWASSTARWAPGVPMRNSFERRAALVELDALAALECGIDVNSLCNLYITQFPVLAKNERETWYDRNGRIAFTVNPSLVGVGMSREDFEAWRAALDRGGAVPIGIETLGLEPPFDRCDREKDMRRAYCFFAEKLGVDIPEAPEANLGS